MVYIFGHKNPDTDSVTSAIVLANLKNKLGIKAKPCMLGDINKESKFVLDHFGVEYPKLIDNVKTQVKDLNYEKIEGIAPDHSIFYAYKMMEQDNIKMLPIVSKQNKLLGIITMKDIAMDLIKGDIYYLKTKLENIVDDLECEVLVSNDKEIEGRISVISFYRDTLMKRDIINEDTIVIVGDRYDIIDYAIDCRAKLIIVTGGKNIPQNIIEKAKSNNVNVILTKNDTYSVSKHIDSCNYVHSIMRTEGVIKFEEDEYLEDIKDELANNVNSNYPVVTKDNKFLGLISRRHILKPKRKEVILVDHNEYGQSVEGLKEAKILEIVDHHKIGDISTNDPISFRNAPVGSTCTIVFNMYKEYGIEIDKKMAGVMLSGIVSDTLLLSSPTTTNVDRQVVKELNQILKLELKDYAMEMFKAGTSLEGQSIEEIFHEDFKEFNIEGNKVGIGQVFTLDIDGVFDRKNDFEEFMDEFCTEEEFFLVILVITDILNKGSYILCKGSNTDLIGKAFEKPFAQGMFVEGVVSRKKQVVPRIIEAIKNM